MTEAKWKKYLRGGGGGEHKVKPEGEEGEGAADGGQTHREEAVSRIIQVVQV